MNERHEFIVRCATRRASIADVCRDFGISERTGHKWLRRFAEDGDRGLEDRSHAPHHRPHKVSSEVERQVIALRRKKPAYNARKIRQLLLEGRPDLQCPAASTIGIILKRNGLIEERRRRPSSQWRDVRPGRTQARAPNDVWTADFKGQFRLGAGPYCYPLTIVDSLSRYLLCCHGLTSTATTGAKKTFERVFRDYGLPKVIRTDNGIPFAAPCAFGRLSTLAVWWIRLGIRPELITPGRPSENGRHERMHRDLKKGTTRPASGTFAAQQRRFDAFRKDYNEQRPHEALDLKTPASQYTESLREYHIVRRVGIEYPAHMEVRYVSEGGHFKWKGKSIFLAASLAGENIGLEEIDEGRWQIAFGLALLGELNQTTGHLSPMMQWRGEPDRVP